VALSAPTSDRYIAPRNLVARNRYVLVQPEMEKQVSRSTKITGFSTAAHFQALKSRIAALV
jgi:hypothetical protein